MRPGLAELYEAFDSDPAPIVGFLRALVEGYALSQPLRVLDVGCGPGRLLRPLERLGWEVTGMEPNPEFLAAARSVAAAHRRVRVRAGGFLDVEDREAFDLVVGINSSFAHLRDAEERRDAVGRIHRALRPGGVACLDLPDFPWILRRLRPPPPHAATVRGEEVTLHRRHEVDARAATLVTRDEYAFASDPDSPVRLVHAYGITTLPELRGHLEAAGFVDVRTFGGYGPAAGDGAAARRMLVAAARPADLVPPSPDR